MILTFVSIISTPKLKEESFTFPQLKNVFPHIQNINVKELVLYSKFEEGRYIVFPNDTSSLCDVLEQKITLEDGRQFFRNVDIRYDDTKHDNTTHYNVYLKTSYPEANKKKLHNLEKCHNIRIQENECQALHIIISSCGKSIRRTIVFLPRSIDKEYYEKQTEFFRKVKEGKLTKSEENKFKKQFDLYSDYLDRE
ncbi:hypothetical protein KY358_00600 [Candidatus Woesearchaeota archaeon]|nr:hypothetical protein [Candidatus Woesearchaeota archaeon]